MTGTKFLPREHGLTITWAAAILLSVLLAGNLSIAGIVLFCLSLPTITLYDPILGALRIWRIREVHLFSQLGSNLNTGQKLLMLILVTVLGLEIILGFAPLIAVIVPLIPLVLLIVSSKFIQERNFFIRSLSVVFVVSQFVLLNSAFTGVVTHDELRDFVFLALINVVIALSVGHIVDARITEEKKERSGLLLGILLSLGSAVVLFPFAVNPPLVYTLFLVVAIASSFSYTAASNLPMKGIGLLSSLWTSLTVVVLVLITWW